MRIRLGSAPRRALALVAGLSLLAGVAGAHGGGLSDAGRGTVSVPTWLFLLTGGGVVGASFLLSSFVTDRAFVRSLGERGRWLPTPGRTVRLAARATGLLALVAVVVVGAVGPLEPRRNLAVLLVWGGWWGGLVMLSYLAGDVWPAVDPFRTLAAALPSLGRPYPARLGAWPSVVGLLGIVWVEVVSPVAESPGLLAGLVVGYGAVTLAGAAVVGREAWFDRVDPVARTLRAYGRVAPVGVEDGRLRLRPPGTALLDGVGDRSEAAFVVGLLYVTTFDGFVGTAAWARFVRTLVGAGVPPSVAYLGTFLAGFAAFLALFRWAAALARRTAPTYRSAASLERRFAASLLPIAAGYHFAHYVGLVLTLGPAVPVVAASPLSPPVALPVVAVPPWFGGVELAAVLAGHLLAVWTAHGVAFESFPGRLQAVRSQSGVTAAMVGYTMVSLWIVSTPYVAPPFL